jgi:hypothetical protein
MSSCTNMSVFSNLVEGFITQYEELVQGDTLTEIESADTHTVLKELYAYRSAIKAGDRNYINDHGFTANQNVVRQGILETSFGEMFGDTFPVKRGNAGQVRQATMVEAKPTFSGIEISFVLDGMPAIHSFSLNGGGRSHDKGTAKSFVTIPGFQELVNHYETNIGRQEELDLVFGSSADKFELKDEYKQTGYVHGSQEHMKTALKKLHVLGGEKAKQSELELYLDYIDKMPPDFFRELELFVKEDAAKSDGNAAPKRIDITINNSPRLFGNQQSEASIYMEEVIHSMTAAAINAKTVASKKLVRQLDSLMEAARKQVDWQDLLPRESIDPVAEEKAAKKLHKYIFVGKQARYELIAKALAVPEVRNALKNVKVTEKSQPKGIMERINDFFSTILDIIQGNVTAKQKTDNVHDSLLELAFRLGEINLKANRDAVEKGGFSSAVVDWINVIDDNAALTLNKGKDALFGGAINAKLGPVPETLYEKIKYFGKFLTLSLINPVYTKAMGTVASAYGLAPEGTVREVIGGMFATDSAQRVAEFLTMQSGYIDKRRNIQIALTRTGILSEFSYPKEITKGMEEALTAVLSDLDLPSIMGKDSVAKAEGLGQTTYDNKTIRKLLTDDAVLDKYIKNAKRALKERDLEHYNWHSNQAVGLGIFMATHVPTPEQNLNAHNIARGLRSTHRKKPNAKVEQAIDELATLVGVKNTEKALRDEVAELMKEDWKGVQHVADIVEGFKLNSDVTVFKGKKTNKIKGYSREVFDDSIMMEIAPAEDQEIMEAQGFTLHTTLSPRAGDKRNKRMALYLTDSSARPERLRGGVRLSTITSKGTSITDLAFKEGQTFSNKVVRERAQRDINRIDREAIKRAELMEKGEYDFTDTVHGVAAVLDEDGNVVDYRYMMDKETKKQLLKQDTRISEVMARSFGNIMDKHLSAEHNIKVLKELTKEMDENWTEGTRGNDGQTEYTLIGPKAADPEMRKLYYMLPREFQQYIKNRADQTLAVRRDLQHMMFGYTHLSITDFPGLKQITPKLLLKVINFAEMMWMEMIKIVKTNILMKMPTVLVSNVFSNFVYAAMRGHNPWTVFKLWGESYRDISNYNKDVRRVQELGNTQATLTVALSKDAISKQKKVTLRKELGKLTGELDALQRRITESEIHELVQLGLDQNVEDVTDAGEQDTNRITSFFDTQLEKVPELVRTGIDIAFITKRTTFYKIANEFLETSDLVARDVQNRLEKKVELAQADGNRMLPTWWLEKQTGVYKPRQRLRRAERSKFLAEAKEQREYDLVEDFINYTKPSSRFEEYLNRTGIWMFTKYVKRIQRIIIKTGGRGPLKSLLSLFTFGYLLDMPSIHEQSLLSKDWYTDSIGQGNIFPFYAPPGQFMNAFTPSLIKESTFDFSP